MTSSRDHEIDAKYFICTAKVNLTSIQLNHKWAQAHHRPISQERIDGIRRNFSRHKCLRDAPRNFIVGAADSRAITAALEKANSGSDESIPFLDLDDVWCLEGFHRIEAARQYLDSTKEEPWWIVRLYSKDIPEHVAIEFLKDSANEKPYDDGDILLNILTCRRALKAKEEQKWWGRLSSKSSSKENNLKQLLGNRPMLNLLLDLTDIPGLWPRVVLGQLKRHHSLKCHEELFNGLKHIQDVWKNDILGPSISPEVVDKATVDNLELLAPKASEVDRLEVQRLMASRAIFGTIDDATEREHLIERICSVSSLIPSLRVFFENQKYLEVCAIPLKRLVGGRGAVTEGSLRKTFYARYRQPPQKLVEVGDGCMAVYERQTFESDRWLAWVSLCVFCLRNFQLSGHAPRKENGKDAPKPAGVSPKLEAKLYALAVAVGFHLPQPDTDIPDYVKARETECAPPSLRLSGQRLKVERRCGRPFENDFSFDKKQLFIPSFFESTVENGGDISPFFVKRDFFWTFLADNMAHMSYLGRKVEMDHNPEPPNPPPEQSQASHPEPLQQEPQPSYHQPPTSHFGVITGRQYQHRHDALEIKIKELEERLRSKEADLAGTLAESRRLGVKCTNLDATSRELQEEIAKLKRERTKFEEKVTQIELEGKRKDSQLAKQTQLEQEMKEKDERFEQLRRNLESGRKRELEESTDETEGLKRQKKELAQENSQLNGQKRLLVEEKAIWIKEKETLVAEKASSEGKMQDLNDRLKQCRHEKTELTRDKEVLNIRNMSLQASMDAEKANSAAFGSTIADLQRQNGRLTDELNLLKARADVAIDRKDVQMEMQQAKLLAEATRWKADQQDALMNQTAQTNQQILQVSQQALQASQEVVRTAQVAYITMEGLWRAQLEAQHLQLETVSQYFLQSLQMSGEPPEKFLRDTQRLIASRNQFVLWLILDAQQPPFPLFTDDVYGDFAPKLVRAIEKAWERGQRIVFYHWDGRRINEDFQRVLAIWSQVRIMFAGEAQAMNQWKTERQFQRIALSLAAEVDSNADSRAQGISSAKAIMGAPEAQDLGAAKTQNQELSQTRTIFDLDMLEPDESGIEVEEL